MGSVGIDEQSMT